MTDKLNFHFPISLLLDQGDKIVAAAEANTAINTRLPASYVTESRTLIGDVTSGDATQKGDVGEIGTLTIAQNDALKVLQPLIAGAKETAKRAFKGNDVKLHSEFQVGVTKPTDLASVLERVRIVSASLKNAANLTALTAKGWLAADAVKIDAAITVLADRGRRHARNPPRATSWATPARATPTPTTSTSACSPSRTPPTCNGPPTTPTTTTPPCATNSASANSRPPTPPPRSRPHTAHAPTPPTPPHRPRRRRSFGFDSMRNALNMTIAIRDLGIAAARVAALTPAITGFSNVMSTPRGQIVNRSALLKVETDVAALLEKVSDMDDLVV